MNRKLKAIYRDGSFILQEPCDLPEEAKVELTIQGPAVIPPKIKDPEEKELILKRLKRRILQNPFPENAPVFTRDELHERRNSFNSST